MNPFLKLGGLELRGNIEESARAEQSARRRAVSGTRTQARRCIASLGDKLYVGEPLQHGRPVDAVRRRRSEVTVDRTQFGAGWFVTPTVLLKSEWMNQNYKDFPTTDIRNGGKIKGFMVEGVVAF